MRNFAPENRTLAYQYREGRNLMQKKLRINQMQCINVPLALLQQSSTDALEWSLVALSVAIKTFSPSSCYIYRGITRFCSDFHIGRTKAHKLLAAIEGGHSLFRAERCRDGLLHITAISFKRQYAYHATFSHRSQRYDSLCMVAVAITARQKDNLRVSAIGHEMRLRLMQSVINAKNRADELKTKGCPLTGSASHAAAMTLSIPLLAAVTGRSARSVIRLSRKAQQSGDLQAIHYPLERRCDDMLHPKPGTDVSCLIRIGNLGFTRHCNDYVILSREVRHAFKHIIYSHRSRLTHNHCTLRPGQTVSQSLLHELYD